MRKTMMLAGVLLGLAQPSHAAWIYDEGEDAFSDEKTATIMATDNGEIAIGAKCWKGDSDETLLMLMTLERYDRAADYPAAVPVKLRTDSQDIHELVFAPAEVGGKLAFVTSPQIHPEIFDIIREWGTAKKRVAFALAGSNHQVRAAGSTREVGRFLKLCDFPAN